MASQIDVINKAGRLLGQPSLTALTTATKWEREAAAAWALTRDSELQAQPWNFARRRKELAASETAPVFDFEYAYPCPADCLQVVNCPELDRRQWTVEDSGADGEEVKSILTKWNNGDALNVLYIAQITEVSKWPPLFCDAVAARLAMDLCETITQSNTKLDAAAQRYGEAISLARHMNAIEKPAQQRIVGDYVLVRG